MIGAGLQKGSTWETNRQYGSVRHRQVSAALCPCLEAEGSSGGHPEEGMTRKHYLKEWEKLNPIVARMKAKNGRCDHELGDAFYFRNPYDKPEGLCYALWHVLQFYAWRVELDFPSWEPDDEKIYRIHCPCETGTIWEMKSATMREYKEYLASKKKEDGDAVP